MWRAVIDDGFDPVTGKRLQKARMSRTKEGAVHKLNQMLRERETVGRVLDRNTRVAELADKWLEDVSSRAKPKTLANYRSNVNAKIKPALGSRLVSDLTPADVRRLHARVRAAGVGYAGISSVHRTLVTMLEYGRAERICTENVAMLAPPRRSQQDSTRESLQREDARALLSIEDPRWTLGLLTGLRSGEACALRHRDLDLESGVATLSWSISEAGFRHGCGGTCGKKRAGNCPRRQIDISEDVDWEPLAGRFVFVRPKNNTARQVPLTPAVTAQLRRHIEEDAEPNPHGLVWHRPDGRPRENSDDNAHLRAALLKAGVDQPLATTHWLRHSYVTLSEHAGVPWAAFSGVSGHGTSEASDPYRHVLTDEGRRAVDALAMWLAEG